MSELRERFLNLITPPEMWARFERMCAERADVRVLWYLVGNRFKALEWIHSVGVCTDSELARHVPSTPPQELRAIVAAADLEEFLWTGLVDLAGFVELHQRHGGDLLEGCRSILDFGCGCGRLLRFFAHSAGSWRASGSDVNPAHVAWCQNLKGVQTSINPTSPPLLYSTASFDFIYSLSIFTHLSEISAAAWLSELARVLRPGGLLIVTVSGVTSIDVIRGSAVHRQMFKLSPSEVEDVSAALEKNGFVFRRYDDDVIKLASAGQDYGAAFIHAAYVRERRNNDQFEVCELIPGGLRNWQDTVVLRRR